MNTVRAALPNLDALDAETLKALVREQHAQLLSHEAEIAHLKLLIAKLQRQQFGRKSERVERQIEQLEQRLEDLETSQAERRSAEKPEAANPVTYDENVTVLAKARPFGRDWSLPENSRDVSKPPGSQGVCLMRVEIFRRQRLL